MKVHNEKGYYSCFDENTGKYLRIGKDRNGHFVKNNPFSAEFPELIDIGIMGHCKHGKSGFCIKSGVECYQDGLNSDSPNMTLDDFMRIAEECRGRTYQFALGGCGDPDQHEHFAEILKLCRENGIVPNFTTSGFGMTEELARLCKKYCGAVAVSWYRSDYTLRAIDMLLQNGVRTNVHYVLSRSTLDEAQALLQGSPSNLGYALPNGINAVIFLMHKPVGLGSNDEMLTVNNTRFWELLHYIDDHEFPYKIGFDSCTVPSLIGLKNTLSESLDTCEGARWSAYISADMKMMPCSFDTQHRKWAVDLRQNTIEQAWHSERFEKFRTALRDSCPGCPERELCMGGCPIVPEIVLCQRKDRKIYENKK